MTHRVSNLSPSSVISAVLMFTLMLACSIVQAKRPFQPIAAFERDHSRFEVAADGSYLMTREVVIRIQSASAIDEFGAQKVSYASSRMEVESIQAWTIQPDGEQIEVPQSAIQTKEEAMSAGQTSFSDTRSKVIIFPKVRVGSRLRYLVKLRCHEPPFPGEFSSYWQFPKEWPEEDFRLELSLPESLKLHVDLRGVKSGPVQTQNGRSSYLFTYSRISAQPPESGSVDSSDFDDRIDVSTFADAIAYGRAYQVRARPKAAVTEAIKSKALEITKGLSDTRAKVRALHHWVASNIRYISVSLGDGGWVPRSADSVLQNLYGDCKDHVVLLEALLDAVGIQSSPALINMGSSYAMSPVGSGRSFNHVITYVPALDLYIDATDRHSPFGVLPFEDMDKPVVLTALDRMGRTPAMRSQDHLRHTKVKLEVRADGSIEGTSITTMTGVPESESRTARSEGLANPEEVEVKSLLDRFKETGTGTLTHPDPDDLEQPFSIRSSFKLDPLANVPGPAGLAIPVGLTPGALRSIANNRPLAGREFNYPCRARVVREQYSLRFAPNLLITSIPKAMSFSEGPIRYRSIYRRSGQTLDVDRELVTQFPSSVCTPNDHQRWKRFHAVLQQDLRAQVVYR